MSKHTPGPWTVDALGIQARWNIDTLEGTSVAITNQLPGDKNWQERDANTILIATAPELLEVLEDLLKEYEGWRERSGVRPNQQNRLMIRAATVVRKAKGVSQ